MERPLGFPILWDVMRRHVIPLLNVQDLGRLAQSNWECWENIMYDDACWQHIRLRFLYLAVFWKKYFFSHSRKRIKGICRTVHALRTTFRPLADSCASLRLHEPAYFYGEESEIEIRCDSRDVDAAALLYGFLFRYFRRGEMKQGDDNFQDAVEQSRCWVKRIFWFDFSRNEEGCS